MMNDELRLVLRSFDEELEQIDRGRLDTLLAESPEARTEQRRLMRMRELVANNAAPSFSANFAEDVLRRVAAEQQADRPSAFTFWLDRVLSGMLSWRFATGMAAAVSVAVALGVVTWLHPQTISVPNGETRVVSLADGSTVQLSGGSMIRYDDFWGRSVRRVELNGQAFFEVAQRTKPFVVRTFNANVEVLGTEFNVKAWPDEAQTQVAVASGRVAVAAREDAVSAAIRGTEAILESGETIVVSADSVTALLGLSVDHVTTWRTGGLAFSRQPLRSVFRTFERRFGVEVDVTDSTINDRLVTYLNPRPQSPEAVLADICHTLDLRYRRTAGGFEILSSVED